MNENARKWVEALRSGEFEQGTGYLQTDGRYCCLGVACEMYRRETGFGEWSTESITGGTRFKASGDERLCELPRPVVDWLGLTDSGGYFEDDCLVDRNDGGATFDAIADIVESEPEGLFE